MQVHDSPHIIWHVIGLEYEKWGELGDKPSGNGVKNVSLQ